MDNIVWEVNVPTEWSVGARKRVQDYLRLSFNGSPNVQSLLTVLLKRHFLKGEMVRNLDYCTRNIDNDLRVQ